MQPVALVGNAPLRRCHAAAIDGAGRVVRFNNAAGLEGRAGSRTDQLWLVNRGGQAAEWLQDPGFWQGPAFAALPEVVLPLPPDPEGAPAQTAPGARDHSRAMRRRIADLGMAIRQMPPDLSGRARDVLRSFGARRALIAPSTGFLAMLHFADEGAELELYGFGFDGWDGHDWAAERAWAKRMVRQGRAVLHPL